MSYDIELKNKVTGETATMRHPQYVRGGNVPARLNPMTGRLEQADGGYFCGYFVDIFMHIFLDFGVPFWSVSAY